ncbi:MAG TPA: hypothetical protein VFZ73_02070, partial [Gemmatimonadaceae bacterium]
TCEEELREILRGWVQGDRNASKPSDRLTGAIALIDEATPRLLAVTSSGVSENACDVTALARTLDGGRQCGECLDELGRVEAQVRLWAEEQRGRELVRLATDAVSPAHTAVLSALSQRLRQAPRAERVSLGMRIARLRDLVLHARGAGAERVLQTFADGDSEMNLDALEALLRSRRSRQGMAGSVHLLAAVAVNQEGNCVGAVCATAAPPDSPRY